MRHVSVLAIPRALGSALTIPLEMLTAANDIASVYKQRDKICALDIVAVEQLECRLTGNFSITCDKLISEVSKTDLIFIPAVWRNPKAALNAHPELVQWLDRQAQAGAILCAATTGAYFCAATGILRRAQATTHWRFFDEFEALFPDVDLQRKRFITYSNGIYCSGSVNAIRDIIVHLINDMYGDQIANEVSRHFMHELKKSYATELLQQSQEGSHHDERVIQIQERLRSRFSEPTNMADMAQHFGMSVRTLNRRFKAATNKSPTEYLQSIRLGEAKELLKESNLNIAEIAHQVGYYDSSYFSELFTKAYGLNPKEYRRLVRNKQFRVNQDL